MNSEFGWNVVSRKKKNVKRNETNNEKDINFHKKKYWCGFNEEGEEIWYIELSDGSIITDKSPLFNKN